MKDLYIFGNFILNFLTEFEVRKKLIVDLLKASLKSKDDDFESIINPSLMQNKNKKNRSKIMKNLAEA